MSRRPNIAIQLNRMLGGSWQAVRDGFGWRYECDDGRWVARYAEPVLGWDGYSDTEFAVKYLDNEGRYVPLVGNKSTLTTF